MCRNIIFPFRCKQMKKKENSFRKSIFIILSNNQRTANMQL